MPFLDSFLSDDRRVYIWLLIYAKHFGQSILKRFIL